MRGFKALPFAGVALLLAACNRQPPPADTSEPQAPASTATAWPASLNVLGDGYPRPGDVCRRIGESMATVDFLDDSADLVGCPGNDPEAIAAIPGKQVAIVDGITLLSVPTGDANAGMAAATAATPVTPPPPSNRPRLVK
jgi:hypothetical protein